nr:MAG TPA: hypothetical protein [Caudoviricetes sp.]
MMCSLCQLLILLLLIPRFRNCHCDNDECHDNQTGDKFECCACHLLNPYAEIKACIAAFQNASAGMLLFVRSTAIRAIA